MGRAEAKSEAFLAVDKIAEGILRLSQMVADKKAIPKRRHPHRYVLKLLEKSAPVQAHYRDLVASVAELRQPLTEAMWQDRWRALVRQIAETIAGVPLTTSEADEFLKWHSETATSESSPAAQMPRDNIYRHSRDGRQVSIRVGSIHSVKGETHTATLVMETFWYEHNLEALLPWLSGDESGGASVGGRQQLRLKIHYVAMTRPAHLLCLAMKRTPVENAKEESDQTTIQKLIHRGWKIKTI
jgi:hypothetical protein